MMHAGGRERSTVTDSHLRSARNDLVGLPLPAAPCVQAHLTESLPRRIAGSLGRPPRMPVIVLSLRRKTRASTGTLLARKARMHDGNVASRPAPLMKPAPFQLERDGHNIFLGEKPGKPSRENQCERM